MKESDVKHNLAAATCALILVASLAACGGSEEKSGLPTYTGGSTPTTKSAKPTPTATATKPGPVALAEHSTNTYGGLKVVVNLPADIPAASRPSLRLFYEFLQADGRTTAKNSLDPALPRLASANVVKETKATTGGESVQGIGSVTYTISKVRTGKSGVALITGCLDQSKLLQVRRDGSHFDDDPGNKFATLKMSAFISSGYRGPEVTDFTVALGSC